MKKILSLLIVAFFWFGFETVEAKPLNCIKDCSTVYVNDEFSFYYY